LKIEDEKLHEDIRVIYYFVLFRGLPFVFHAGENASAGF